MIDPKKKLPTDITPDMRRSARLYAPVTNYMQGSDAAVGKLVDNRLKRAGGPMPSTVGPPAPAAAKTPSFLERAAPTSAALIASGTTARPGESIPEMLGRGARGAAGMLTAIPEAGLKASADVAGAAIDAAKGFVRGAAGAPPAASTPTAAAAPAAAPPRPAAAPQQTATTAPAAPAAPAATTPPAAAPLARATTDITFTGDGKSGKANAAAPGQVAVGERTGTPLPGAPKVGADGSVVYDQAFMDANKGMVQNYANRNVVPTVVPGAGVAASQMTAGQMPQGALTRAPQGFTAQDRAAQLDALDRLGAQYRRSKADDNIKMASLMSKGGHFRTARAQLEVAGATNQTANDMEANPRVSQFQRSNPDSAAALALQAEKMNREQGLLDEQVAGQQLQNAGMRQQQKQAEIMQNLQADLLGDDQAKAAAAATKLAALQGSKPGEPLIVEREVPVADAMGGVTMQKVQGVYDPASKQVQWMDGSNGQQQQPPAAPPSAIDYLRANDTPQMRQAFQAKYGIDPARILGK